jgi:hypothetical protein
MIFISMGSSVYEPPACSSGLRELAKDGKCGGSAAASYCGKGAVPACCLRTACSIGCLFRAKPYGAAAQPVSPFFLKRRALTDEKRRPFLGSGTTSFVTPLPRKDKLF